MLFITNPYILFWPFSEYSNCAMAAIKHQKELKLVALQWGGGGEALEDCDLVQHQEEESKIKLSLLQS